MKENFISLFNASVKQYPNNIALQTFSDKLSYKQLDYLSNQVAGHIISQNIAPNSSIILEVDKSLATIVYILGIMKAECFYIPVMSNIPENRFHFIRKKSQCKIAFLTRKFQLCEAIADFKCFSIEKNLAKLVDGQDKENFRSSNIKPTDPACCLYTSGSTGHPKGVLISHAGITAFFRDVAPCMQMTRHAVCLNTAPFIFDVSIIDTFFPLSLGATVLLSPEPILPNVVLKSIQENKVTHMCGVSSTLNLLFNDDELLNKFDISSLTTIMTGAELLYQKTLATILKHSHEAKIINGYGLTETTCACTVFTINKNNVYDHVLYPIGKPLAGIKVKILTDSKRDSKRGELLLKGDQIMLRYINDPVATSQAFIVDEGETYLRTGDIVSYDEDSNLVFHGRNDTQMKLNGYRIDLNEIKYTLLSVAQVQEAEVLFLNSMIVAMFSPKPNTLTLDENELIKYIKTTLSSFLPRYMQPQKWILLESLPKLASGKTDLKQLCSEFGNNTIEKV